MMRSIAPSARISEGSGASQSSTVGVGGVEEEDWERL
jgi:hypothetical protein